MKRWLRSALLAVIACALVGCVADYHPPPPDPIAPSHDNGGSGGGGGGGGVSM